MKVAMAATGNTLDSKIDASFGRCSFYVIFDDTNGAVEFLPNPNKNLEEGAGQASVKLLASKTVSKIVSGEFGIKIKPLLDSLKIQMIVLKDEGKTVKDVLELLNH
ncbi:MAG: NifB/NifX family molybdenum-iron cluster-binding protein [Lentimicrobium sp.]|jgi:predicted Fe-Mo cluster-binding NifX family protein